MISLYLAPDSLNVDLQYEKNYQYGSEPTQYEQSQQIQLISKDSLLSYIESYNSNSDNSYRIISVQKYKPYITTLVSIGIRNTSDIFSGTASISLTGNINGESTTLVYSYASLNQESYDHVYNYGTYKVYGKIKSENINSVTIDNESEIYSLFNLRHNGNAFYSVLNSITNRLKISHGFYFNALQLKITATDSDSQLKYGSIIKGGKYRIAWSYNCSDSESLQAIKSVSIRCKDPNGIHQDVVLVLSDGSVNYGYFDSSLIKQTESFEYRLEVTTAYNGSERVGYSEWSSCSIEEPSMLVDELYPTGNTEQGVAQVFRWHLNVNTPDSAVGLNVYQTSAEVQYRPAGATEYSSVTVSGSSETVTLAGDVLPVGDIEWRVVVHTNVGFDTASSWKSCTNIKNTITPVLSSPSGTISKGGIYRLQWTYQASTSAGVCAGTVIEYKPIGADASRVTLEAGATTFDLDTGAINSMEGMMWRVMATSDSGNDTWCEWRTNYFSSPSMSIGELFPTGTVYHGFDVTFRWALSVSLPSGALRVNVSQNGGELRYRLQGESGYSTAIISGAAQTVTIGGSVLPIGVVEWQVLLHTNVGYDCVSSWQTCRNEEVSITVTDLSPGTEGRAPRGVSNRFSWSFVPEGVEDLPGPITQVSATLYWKSAALTAYHTVSVEGENKFADIPAGTFDGLEEIDWYVVAKASTGTTGTSEVVRVSTLDTLSNPAAISPAGVFLDDAVEGLTFLWQHANQTGTPQCGYELDYSSDSGASYTTLHAGEDDAQSWTSAPGTFPNTTIYWRVRTKNTDGVFGSWSSPAIFAIRRLPDAPAITYLDAKPLPAIGWQSETQTGYEVELDGVSYGMRHGNEKQWRSPALLADGEHTIRVRIINLYRDISPWAATTFLVANKPAGTCRVLAEEQFGQVVLVAECEGDFRSVMLLRDDKPMALLSPGQTYIDRTGVGSHIYMLRAFDANGYYTDSAACCAAPRVPYGALGLLDGDGWTLLKWSPSRDRYAKSVTETGSFVQYYGSNRPVWRGTGCLTAVHRMTYCFKKGDDLRSIEALRGSIVVYKDYEGHLAIGVFEAVPITAQNGLPCVEISITETQQEEIDYGGV